MRSTTRSPPEHSLRESVDAVERVLADEPVSDTVLCGDSAGAALALATAVCRPASVSGLMLTNPNIDLTLAHFDANAPDGPDAELSARAFAEWTREWSSSSDFVTEARRLPPTFIAVGLRDAVLPEARDLADAVASAGQRAQLAEYDTGHGFLGDDAVNDDVLTRARGFFAT